MSGVAPRRHAGRGDGERVREGRIGQPANTASSLAFVVASAPMAVRALRRPHPTPWLALAGATALVGIGSVGFHGPGDRLGKAVHDAGVAAVAATLPLAVAVDRPVRPPWASIALGAAAVALHTQSRTGRRLAGTDGPVPGHAVFHVLAAVALALVVPAEAPAASAASAASAAPAAPAAPSAP